MMVFLVPDVLNYCVELLPTDGERAVTLLPVKFRIKKFANPRTGGFLDLSDDIGNCVRWFQPD